MTRLTRLEGIRGRHCAAGQDWAEVDMAETSKSTDIPDPARKQALIYARVG